MDLLVSRLCGAAFHAPLSISLHFEQILSDIAPLDPTKFLRLVSRFISERCVLSNENSKVTSSVGILALHILASAIVCLRSSQLLLELPFLVPLLLPAFKSDVVDLRKAAVFTFVEMYLVVGDALHEHVADLSQPQLKLLTIYIDKKMAQRAQLDDVRL